MHAEELWAIAKVTHVRYNSLLQSHLLLVHIAVGVLVLGSSETTHLAADFELAFTIQVNLLMY